MVGGVPRAARALRGVTGHGSGPAQLATPAAEAYRRTMNCCSHCQDAGRLFGARTAGRELRRYRRKGPTRSTQLLLDLLPREDVAGASLLDVGGGVGVVQHELLERGLASATHVDASPAYLAAASEEAQRRGVGSGTGPTVVRLLGDFVDMASDLAPADLVTLDRVICCYPDAERLLDAALSRTGRLLGLVYPRKRWGSALALAAGNLWMRVTGSTFRVHLHPPEQIRTRILDRGFRVDGSARTFLWQVETFRRGDELPSEG